MYPTAVHTHALKHTTTHTHPWKKPLTLRPHRVHVSPSGIINTMLMNIGLGPGPWEERRERWRERAIKRAEGWRMEEDNGFSPNEYTAQGTFGGSGGYGKRFKVVVKLKEKHE